MKSQTKPLVRLRIFALLAIGNIVLWLAIIWCAVHFIRKFW
jgi:hypothetical protein